MAASDAAAARRGDGRAAAARCPRGAGATGSPSGWLRIAAALVLPAVLVAFFFTFGFLKSENANKALQVSRRRRGGRRRDLGALLGHGPAHQHAAIEGGGCGASLRVRRAWRRPARLLPGVPGDQHHDHQLPELQLDRLGRVGQLRADLHREHLPGSDPQQLRLGPGGPRRCGAHRPLLRHPGRQAAATRRSRFLEVADLPADGDLLRRRVRGVEVRLQLPRRGLRRADRSDQRHRAPLSADGAT